LNPVPFVAALFLSWPEWLSLRGPQQTLTTLAWAVFHECCRYVSFTVPASLIATPGISSQVRDQKA